MIPATVHYNHVPSAISKGTRATEDTQVIRMWLHRKSKQTIRAYSRDVRDFFAFVGCALADVLQEDVQAFADSLVEGLAPSSQVRRLAAVKSLLSFANRIGHIPFNVGAAVELPKAGKSARRTHPSRIGHSEDHPCSDE